MTDERPCLSLAARAPGSVDRQSAGSGRTAGALAPLFPLPMLVAPGATPGWSPWFDFLAGQASGHQPDHRDLDHGLDMCGWLASTCVVLLS